MIYESEKQYILDANNAAAKITAIDNCIDALLTSVLDSVGKASTSEYMLNDGQTIIKKVYRNPHDVITAVSALRILRTQYANDCSPRQRRMVDIKNLITNKFGR